MSKLLLPTPAQPGGSCFWLFLRRLVFMCDPSNDNFATGFHRAPSKSAFWLFEISHNRTFY